MNAPANTAPENSSNHLHGGNLHSSSAPHRSIEHAHGVLLDWRLVIVYLAVGIIALSVL